MPMTTTTMRRPPIVGVPSFVVVALRSLLADPLAEPERVQERMYGDMRMTISANARSSPWMSSTWANSSVIGQPAAELAPEAVDDGIERDAARCLDEDDVAVAQAGRQRRERRVGVADPDDGGPVQAGRLARRRRCPPRRRRRPSANRRSGRRPRPPHGGRRRSRSPSSSISPRTAPRRPGSPASRSSAAATDRGEAL